jgi:hypothetical protein
MLFLPAVAGAQTAGEGLVTAAGIDGVQDVQLLDDGSARITLENGRVLKVSAEDVVIGASGEVQVSAQVADIVAESAAGCAGGGGAIGAIAAGAAAGVAGLAGAGGGGGDDGSASDAAPVVLNSSDVAGLTTFADVFGREPAPDAERVTITVGERGDPIVLTDPADRDTDGNWTLPEDFAENFEGEEGEVTVSFTAERVVPEEDDQVAVEGENLGVQAFSAAKAPDFEEVDSGSITLLVDTVAPTIAIDPDIAGDGVLNIAEQGEDLIITGTTDAEDGQEVTVTVADETYTSTASGGAWSVNIPSGDLTALSDDDTVTVEATVEDAAGNPANTPAIATFDTDFTGPNITIDDVSGDNQIGLADVQGDLEITGTTDAAAGQAVSLTFDGQLYTGSVADGGHVWSVIVPQSAVQSVLDGAGENGLAQVNVNATVEDQAGNPAAQAATSTVDADFNGPSIGINPIAVDNVINDDESTSDVIINGTTGNVGIGQDVTVTVDGIAIPSAQTDANGDWSVTLLAADAAGLGDGASVTVTADVADSEGVDATQATATLSTDFTAPTIDIDSPIAGDDLLNIAEQDAGFGITGTSDAADGQEVTVTLSGAVGTPVTATGTMQGGAWTANFTPAQADDLSGWPEVDVAATVEDTAGNEGQATAGFDTDLDPPTVTIDTLPVGIDGVLSGAENATDLEITGTATDTDQVTVTFNGAELAPANVSGGAWSITIPSATLQGLDPEATIQVSAAVEDDAGNTDEADRSFATDFTPPSLTVDPLEIGGFLNIVEASGDVTLTGTVAGNDGEDVTVSVDGQEVTASVDAQGDWTATFAAGALAALSDGETEFSISTQDAAGNPATTTSASFTVDLTPPEITVDDPPTQPFVLDVAEREDADGFGFTTSESGNETVTLTFTSAGGSVDLTLTETLGNIPETGGVFDFPLTPADLATLEDQTDYTVEIGITDAAGNTVADGFDLSTDFEPSINLDAIGDEGVLILDDIDPNNVSVSGTTSGVEVDQAVTVTIRDEAGNSIFTNNTAIVQGDGTWSLDLPSATVEALDAGQTYDVQADVNNAAGRAADQASQEVVAYLPAAVGIFESAVNGSDITYDLLVDLEKIDAGEIEIFVGTVEFDASLVTVGTFPRENVLGELLVTEGFNDQFAFTDVLDETALGEGLFSVSAISLSGAIDDFSEPLFSFDANASSLDSLLRLGVTSEQANQSVNQNEQFQTLGDSVSLFGTSGVDTVSAENVDTFIRGRGEADSIDLSGAGVNTVLFEADPMANGFDTVTDFSIGGSLPDRLGFAGLDNETLRGDGTTFELLGDGGAVGVNTGLIVFTTAMADLTAASVQAAVEDLNGPSDGDVMYFLASDSTDAQLYEVQVQDGDDQVTEMARFEGLGDLSSVSDANILGFDTNPLAV